MPSITGKLFQECIKISNTEVARKQFLSLTFLVVGFTAVCAQGFAFLYYWSVPVSKLSFSLRVKQAPAAVQEQHSALGLLQGCDSSSAGSHHPGETSPNSQTGQSWNCQVKSEILFWIVFQDTDRDLDWREQPASGSQPVMLAVRRALVKPSVKQPKWCRCTFIPQPLPAAGAHGLWVLSQVTQQRGAGWWVRSTGCSPAAMACYLSPACVGFTFKCFIFWPNECWVQILKQAAHLHLVQVERYVVGGEWEMRSEIAISIQHRLINSFHIPH